MTLFQRQEGNVKLSIVCIQDLSYAVFPNEQTVNPLILVKTGYLRVYVHTCMSNNETGTTNKKAKLLFMKV